MSGDRYKITGQNGIYFLTLTVADWIDVLTRKEHRYTIVGSLIYCLQQKGLVLYGWSLMNNHLHLIVKAAESYRLSEILRCLKKITARAILAQIQKMPESRRDWMLYRFKNAGKHLKRIKQYKFWKDDNPPRVNELYLVKFDPLVGFDDIITIALFIPVVGEGAMATKITVRMGVKVLTALAGTDINQHNGRHGL